MKLTRRFIVAACLSLFAFDAAAKAPTLAPVPIAKPPVRMPTGAELVLNADLGSDVAFLVVDLQSGEMLEAFNADLPLPPASVAKVPTALYALDAFGPDHRFETRLVEVGSRVDGVLQGDLVLQGGGDPEIDTASLDLLAFRAVEGGLRGINGRFLVDGSLIPSIERIDQTQPEVASYNPAVSGLNLNFNRVYAQWRRKSGRYNLDVQARSDTLSPSTDAVRLRVVNETPTGRTFHYASAPQSEEWEVRGGALGKAGSRWLPVRKPEIYSGRVFARLAKNAGLTLPVAEGGRTPLVADVAARVESRRLSDILADMLRYSTNLTAEVTGLGATRALLGGTDTLLGSGRAMNSWASTFAGFAPGDPGFSLTNHSGLSGDARASVRRLVDVLVAADKRGFPSLEGGRGATLKGLLPRKEFIDSDVRRPNVEATLRAKTGTLNFVSALAGYIDSAPGKRLAFAVIAADLPRRAAIADPSVESPTGSRSYNSRARRLHRALVRSWIDRFGT